MSETIDCPDCGYPTKELQREGVCYGCVYQYFDVLDSVFFRNDGTHAEGGQQARRLAAYLREVHQLPAEANYHHAHWRVEYTPGQYTAWRDQRFPASQVAHLIHGWGLTGVEVVPRSAQRDASMARALCQESLEPLRCDCNRHYLIRPHPLPPHRPECDECRKKRVSAEIQARWEERRKTRQTTSSSVSKEGEDRCP